MKPSAEQLAGLHGACETVMVSFKNGDPDAVINAHDFDPEKHEKVEPKKEKAKK